MPPIPHHDYNGPSWEEARKALRRRRLTKFEPARQEFEPLLLRVVSVNEPDDDGVFDIVGTANGNRYELTGQLTNGQSNGPAIYDLYEVGVL